MATAAETEKRKTKRDRSPSYPGVDLQEALQRAETLYRSPDRQHHMPVETALKHWGFEAKSSQGQVILAALKKFGLLEDEGRGPGRQVRLTKEAVSIISDPREDQTEKAQAIQRAALTPTIHRDAWDKYHADLPSDGNFKHWLRNLPIPFTERGADEFIPQYRRTIAFAKLAEAAKIPEGEGDKPESREALPVMQPPASKGSPGTETVRFPIRVGVWGQLQVPAPMTEDDWQRMLKGIESQKLGLVAESAKEDQ